VPLTDIRHCRHSKKAFRRYTLLDEVTTLEDVRNLASLDITELLVIARERGYKIALSQAL
jgi:hypothetical protein